MSQTKFQKSNKGMTILTKIISGIALAYIFAMLILMVYLAITGGPDNALVASIVGLFVGSTVIYAILMYFHDKKQEKLKEEKKHKNKLHKNK